VTPKLSHILLGFAGCILLAGLLTWGIEHARAAQGAKHEQAAQEAKGEANAHQTQAQASDKVVTDLKTKLDDQAAQLARLQSERAVLLRRLAAKPQPDPAPADLPVPVADGVGDDRDALIAKDAEVIAAQALFIDGQKTEILALTTSRDQWKATAEQRERQAQAQEQATKAWKDAVTASTWKGRIQGFAAGIALGYVGGKR